MKDLHKLVTAITVNYKTIDVTLKCLKALRHHYPKLHIIIIDNSNFDASSDALYKRAKQDTNITCLFNIYNMHHGPSVDIGIRMLRTPLAFVLDSDAFIKEENVIEDMFAKTVGVDEWLMVGDVTPVDKNGFDLKDPNQGIPYGDPKCMLLNKECYLTLPKFIRHGAPCIETMTYIHENNLGHLLIKFPWEQYVYHGKGVTQRRFGLDGDGGDPFRRQNIPPYTSS